MYIVAAILRNALTFMYGNSTSDYFALNPPTIHHYCAWTGPLDHSVPVILTLKTSLFI